MHELRREEFENFVQHVLQETESLLPGTVDLPENTPCGRQFIVRFQSAREFGVAGDSRPRMPGHLDLGNHRNEAVGGIADNLANFILRVKSAVRLAVEEFRSKGADHRLLADRTLFGEQRIALDLDAPALILSQVPMETVDFVDGHQVDVTFEVFRAEEVAADVEVHAPVGETGRVLDPGERHRPVPALPGIGINPDREHL